MGLKLEIYESDKTRGMTLKELDNVNFLLTRETEYESYYIYSYRERRNGEDKFIGYAGACLNSEFDDALAEDFPEGVDVYICPNGTKTPYRRTKEQLVNIQNLVIDIDAHDEELSTEELNKHINKFSEQLLSELEIKPNFINYTGRGIHLWYCIEPLHASLDYAALAVSDMICQIISKFIEETDEQILKIDKKVSMSLCGIIRLPYTYNTSAKMWSYGELIHEEIPHINQLKDKLTEMGYTSEHWKSKKTINQEKYQLKKKTFIDYAKKQEYIQKRIEDQGKDYTNCINHRLKFLHKLITEGKVFDGRRHQLMLALCATLIRKFNNDETWELLNEYNYMITPPLTQTELSDMYKQVIKKTHKFKNQTFLNFVNASEEEIAEFCNGKKSKTKKPKQRKINKRQLARDAKKEKYQKVLELYNQGMKKIDISKTMKISRTTIDKIIRESV